MPVLKTGSAGPAVTKLQLRLKELGFKPGKIDGDFGPRTKAAVIAFQKRRKLKVDGIAGPKTMAALRRTPKLLGPAPIGRTAKKVRPTKTRKPVAIAPEAAPIATAVAVAEVVNVTAELVSKMFPGTPLINIQENLPYVMAALQEAGLADRDMILMALATIRAETGNFTPLSEFRSKFNTSPGGHAFNLYDNRKDLGNTGRPDGSTFKGRGYIQLTGRNNYAVHGAAIGLGDELVNNPDLANRPEIAAKLLASFLKTHEERIREALAAGDLKHARRLVNGGSHGLAAFTRAFKIGQEVL